MQILPPSGTEGSTEPVSRPIRTSPAAEWFVGITQYAPVGALLLDRDCRIIQTNATAVELLAAPGAPLGGTSLLELAVPQDRSTIGRDWSTMCDSGTCAPQQERQFLRGDGRLVWVLLTLAPVPEDREAAGIAYLEDITERKAKDTERDRLTERVELAARAGGIGIWEWDVGTQNIIWDEALLTRFGLSPDSPEAKKSDFWMDWIHPDDRDRTYRELWLAVDHGAPYDTEFRMILPDGSLHYMRGAATVVRDSTGKVLRVVGIHWDITASKLAEEAQSVLAERITLAVEAGQLGIWEVNLLTREQYWNGHALRQFGMPPGRAPPEVPEWMELVDPKDREPLESLWTGLLSGQSGGEATFSVVPTDGTTHRLRTSTTVVRDRDGRPIRIAGVNVDITEQTRLAESLAAERDRLKEAVERWATAKQAADEANRAKSEFLTTMSHELRTPLNAILGFGQLLANPRFGSITEKQREYLEAILQSGSHLLELIDEILELSTIEAGKMEVTLTEVDVVPIVELVIATLSPAARKARVTLDAGSFAREPPVVRADRVRLVQALLNLGSNAIKYNRPDGMVQFDWEPVAGGWIRLTVRDTGIGIPEDRHTELFQPFNRLGVDRLAIEGTGVGLALTRKLVTLMEGRVGFDSKLGQGSVFWIDLPPAVSEVAA